MSRDGKQARVGPGVQRADRPGKLGAVAGRVPDASVAAFACEPEEMMRITDLPVANAHESAAADHWRPKGRTFGLDVLR